MSKSPYILTGLIVVSTFAAAVAEAQVYSYTHENGILILSNVPTDDKMRLIADGTAEEAGRTWRYSGQSEAMVMKASRLFGVDSAFVRAVIAVESTFNRYARSYDEEILTPLDRYLNPKKQTHRRKDARAQRTRVERDESAPLHLCVFAPVL